MDSRGLFHATAWNDTIQRLAATELCRASAGAETNGCSMPIMWICGLLLEAVGSTSSTLLSSTAAHPSTAVGAGHPKRGQQQEAHLTG